MKTCVGKGFLALAILVLAGAPAWAQTSTISGVVIDRDGGVVPGADVVIKHNATGVTTSTVTTSEGAFSFPGVQTGSPRVSTSPFLSNQIVIASSTGGTPSLVVSWAVRRRPQPRAVTAPVSTAFVATSSRA